MIQVVQGSLSESGPWVHWFSWKYNRVWTGSTVLAHEAEEMCCSCLVGPQEERLELQRPSLCPQRCWLPFWAYRANVMQPCVFGNAVPCHQSCLWLEQCSTLAAAMWNCWCSAEEEILQGWALSCWINQRDTFWILRCCIGCKKVWLLRCCSKRESWNQ